MKNYKKTITMLLTTAVLLTAVFMMGCTKLSETPNSTTSEVDAPADVPLDFVNNAREYPEERKF